ncbi:sialic acid-binding Ig-like lectin 13 [Chaetodon trifascialis]|uniref:sialic acid-binding Ig-like lectin 13 n=1 Tax=Chaetodon trifascialis TaxID=109706 RepID=UPI003990E8BA
MTATLTLLIGCLLQGALCGQFNVIMPQAIEVLSGSCVTIPCSFDITDKHELNLNQTCKAIWKRDQITVFDSSISLPLEGHLEGDLTRKNCTTTLNYMQAQNRKYFFRLECDNALKYNFLAQKLEISVKNAPPTPTLTPSTLTVKEGSSVSLKCSAPAPCLSRPPTLKWTPSLADSQETLQDNPDQTKVMTSVLTFTASFLHHRQEISCTAVYNKQDGSTKSVGTGLTVDILFAPRILSSSVCTKAADHLNCSCETVGNPSPTSEWYLDELPINHSDKFTTSNESLNDTCLRSTITVNQPQWRDRSTLLCRSSNSLGSATQRFHVCSFKPQTPAESHDLVTLAVFITTAVALLALVCALLFVIRAQKTQRNLLKSIVAISQLLTTGEGNEAPNATEEDIYVNVDMPRQADVAQPAAISEPNLPSSEPNNAEEASSETNEESSDVIYSNVIWKSKIKKNGEEAADMDQAGSSCLEEERCLEGGMSANFVSSTLEIGSLSNELEPKNVNQEVECEYAEVKFQNKSAMHT